jgi:hypothetical protein
MGAQAYDADMALFERRAEGFQGIARNSGNSSKEQDAVVGEARFAGTERGVSVDEGGGADAGVRAAEEALVEEAGGRLLGDE